jgi:hypothetical protein
MSTIETDLGRDLDDEGRRQAARQAFDEREPQTLERDIDATRADLRATLEALERRLSLDRMMELTVGRIRERGGEFAGNLTDAATRNPVPLLLTSIGLGWMMLASRNGGGRAASTAHEGRGGIGAAMRERFEHARDGVDRVRERVGEGLDHARERVGEGMGHARDRADYARERLHQARGGVDQARDRMDRLLDEQPLLLGAFGIAAGAIIGALLPTTEAEDRWVGDVRNKAVRNVAQASREGYESAREQAESYSAPGGNSGTEDGADRSSSPRPH